MSRIGNNDLDHAIELWGGALIVTLFGLVVGCHASKRTEPLACGDTGKMLVDRSFEVPDSGSDIGVSTQIPPIGVNKTHLYFLSSWSTYPEQKASPTLVPMPTTSKMVWNASLIRVPIAGGERERVDAAMDATGPAEGLAVTDTAVIYSQAPQLDGGPGKIVRVSADGGKPTVLAETTGVANTLVADDENVYFADFEGTKSVSLASGSVRALAPGIPTSLVLVGQTLYMIGAESISSVSTAGGPVSVVSNTGGLFSTSCGKDLCFMTAQALMSSLVRLTPDGTTTVLAENIPEPHAVVFDGSNFFVSSGGGGLSLLRIPAAGGKPVLVPSAGAVSLALDETCLYWSGAGGIYNMSTGASHVASVTGEAY